MKLHSIIDRVRMSSKPRKGMRLPLLLLLMRRFGQYAGDDDPRYDGGPNDGHGGL